MSFIFFLFIKYKLAETSGDIWIYISSLCTSDICSIDQFSFFIKFSISYFSNYKEVLTKLTPHQAYKYIG